VVERVRGIIPIKNTDAGNYSWFPAATLDFTYESSPSALCRPAMETDSLIYP